MLKFQGLDTPTSHLHLRLEIVQKAYFTFRKKEQDIENMQNCKGWCEKKDKKKSKTLKVGVSVWVLCDVIQCHAATSGDVCKNKHILSLEFIGQNVFCSTINLGSKYEITLSYF